MDWDLDRGPRLPALLAKEKRGLDVPELMDRPSIPRSEQWLWDAWESLSTERPQGFGPGMIPHSVARRYALDLELGADLAYELWEVIHDLDMHWMAEQAVKRPRVADVGGTTPGGRLSHQDNGRPVRRGRRKSEG